MKNQLMIRQYEHLKNKYTLELLTLLSEYKMPLEFVETT